ncbi:MAG: DUF2163 domain-containing protein [Pikeienuella sp.]
MRNIPPGLKAKLESRETTLCHCWLITPKFGAPLGFTDHDCDIGFDGVTYEAASGFEASGVERELGLSIDNATATGALQSDRITEQDIQRGRFDSAEVKQWLVDWSAPEDRLLTFRGEIGEVSRSGAIFEAELRGLAERLNRPIGRRFLHVCDADFGDARCGLDADAPEFRAEGTVIEARGVRSFLGQHLGAFSTASMAGGRLTWTAGANAGQSVIIRNVTEQDSGVLIEIDRDLVDTPKAGDAFLAVVGCDKRKATCAEKFNNLNNFRGFPFMPGEAWITAYPVEGDVHDGGSQSGG